MDAVEATRVVIDKITRLEPEHVVKKIIGYIYFQGLTDEDMIRLALGPESSIHGLIQNAKNARLFATEPLASPVTNPSPLPDPLCQFGTFTPATTQPDPMCQFVTFTSATTPLDPACHFGPLTSATTQSDPACHFGPLTSATTQPDPACHFGPLTPATNQSDPTCQFGPFTSGTAQSDPTCQFVPFMPGTTHPHCLPAPPVFRRVQPHQLGIEQQQMHNPSFKLAPYCDYAGLEDSADGVSLSPPGFLNNYYCPEAAFHYLKSSRTPQSIMDHPPIKTCHYFTKGYCKHGNSCRYLHRESSPETYPHMSGRNPYDVAGEDQMFSPGSLEKLELEIVELLKSRRGNPVSIASLPMMYYEKYGRTLQAEGYLTESQRHGKAGYSLTKLLARLKNSIRLIDRPHGQHAVILAEDASKYMDNHGTRNEPSHIVNGSRQIYLTFPAESTFTEEDVSKYFSTFGSVHDVRIPCQQRRMFGFVTFASADTVKLILSKGNPHNVCGARVLVKPYREKSKLVERKYLEKFDHPVYYNSHPKDLKSELQARSESSRLFRRHLIEEREQALELERMRLSQLNLACKPVANHPCLGYPTAEDQSNFPSTRGFSYLLDILNSCSTSDDIPSNNADQESSQGLNLPDSPFAAAVASSISTIM